MKRKLHPRRVFHSVDKWGIEKKDLAGICSLKSREI